MRVLLSSALVLCCPLAVAAGAEERVLLDNAYARVTRDAAPCAGARGPDCGDRILVALGPTELPGPRPRTLARGEVAVFKKTQAYTPPVAGRFLEVNLKPNRPPVETPPVHIAPEKNALLYDGEDFFVFEERLSAGDTRPRHSHSQRVVVVLDPTRLQQWPDGAPEVIRDQVPDDVRFNAPVVHSVKNVGPGPLRSVVIELKGAPAFKLGTFELGGRTIVGLVLGDQKVIDIGAANAALEKIHPGWPKLIAPADMKDLIARYDTGMRERLHAIAREAAASRASYVHQRKDLRIRPPVPAPEVMVNAAVNYTEHESEMGRRAGATPPPAVAASQSAPGLWERRADDPRPNPYLFLKSRSALIADGEIIRIPPGRDRVDWECELAVVVGRRASRVPLDQAADYIFGYTLENDVSDRGGRGDTRFGTDWLLSKSHDTYAPMGPFVVPREFVADPQKLGIRFSLSGTLMQDSSTERMTHNVYELLHYASNILTLQPGDVISTGSPAGVGSARNPPIFMKPGEVAVCTIESVGTLTNPVAAAGSAEGTSSRSR